MKHKQGQWHTTPHKRLLVLPSSYFFKCHSKSKAEDQTFAANPLLPQLCVTAHIRMHVAQKDIVTGVGERLTASCWPVSTKDFKIQFSGEGTFGL
jgi:hypothetical protein